MKDAVVQRVGLPPPVGPRARTPAAPLPPIDVVVRGDVPHAAIPYAHNKLVRTMSALEEPVLHARLKLTMLPDPAMARPAVAEAILDVDGDLVRAHVAARTTAEAADLLERRLGNRLDHAQHVLDRGAPVPSVRPSYCDRPVQARELVRHTTFTLAEVSVDEAISDMEVLDYDFHLFRDRASGENSLVWRSDDGGYALARLHASEVPSSPPTHRSTSPGPTLPR